MLNFLVRYRIITNRGMGIVAGNYINVYWDDIAETYEVQKFDNASDTSGTVISVGPDLGARDIDFAFVSGLQDPSSGFTFLQYRFCDSTTLVTFFGKSLFPYVEKVEATNHESCSLGVVCDLIINDGHTVQKASAVDVADGAISVTAESSNGTIKFALDDPDFDYSSQGQESGDFPGILPGVHTITAKDEAGCFDQIEITVPHEVGFGVRYRHEYIDINHNGTRIDILERDYDGELEEIKGGDHVSFVLKYSADSDLSKFKSTIPSKATLTLLAQTNFKFRHLFSQDDRKFKLNYYKNYGVSSGGFTPAALDDLEDWTNEDIGGEAWNTSIAAPYVEFTDTEANAESDLLITNYTFVAGQLYTFGYELRGGDGVTVPTDATFYIQILDSSNGVILQKIVAITQSFPLASPIIVTGEYSFSAPFGAAKIGIKCVCLFDSAFTNYFVDAFTNETDSIAADDWEFKWTGFVIGDNYSEAYLATPYPVSIVATDGLADLKNVSFLDLNEQKYREDIVTLDAINDILARTELDINIRGAINRYEQDMDQGASDDPLNQCKFNPKTFYHDDNVKNCFDVLEEILKPFGARILQRNAKWFITSIEEHLSTIDYREFDSEGNLIETGTINDLVNIDFPLFTSERAAFRNKEQVLETIPAFGRMFFEHTLLKQNSLIASYGFEVDDVIISPEGFVSFKDWNVNIAEAPAITYGIKETRSLEGDFNFYVRGIEGQDKYLTLRTKTFQIEHSGEDAFELSFEYVILLLSVVGVSQVPYWVRLKWLFKVGDYYFREDLGWVDGTVYDPYNHVYANKFNDISNVKIRSTFKSGSVTVTDDCHFEIFLEGATVADFEIDALGDPGYDGLRAVETPLLPLGHKQRGFYSAEAPSNLSHKYYNLESGTATESLPDVVVPDDYNASTNPRFWKLEKVDTALSEVEYIYLDNVVLLHFPETAEPPKNITLEKENNKKIKLNFEGQYLLNDIDTENINNSERTYKNFFKLLDGTPTQVWARSYRPGEGKLLELLTNDYASQYKKWSNRLTGSFIADREVLPTSVMNEVNDDGCKYMFSEYELFDKEYSIRFNLSQLGDVFDEDGEAIDADFNIDFSLDFHS